MKRKLTLCMIHQPPNVLLGMKKRGFGAGRWNGFGGKLEEGETLEEATIREVEEEVGVKVKNLEKIGLIDFIFEGKEEIMEVHIFKTSEFEGEITESEEMAPRFFHIAEIPFSQMWPSDLYWFPLFLKGNKFKEAQILIFEM